MPNYRRYFQPGGTYFFTVVTYNRIPIFKSSIARELLGVTFRAAKERYPFAMEAICLLPDHLHCLWTLPETDQDFSIRWSFIKSFFTHRYISQSDRPVNSSREKRREGSVWQRRFWEHLILDDDDLENHFNYIHFNPVKHGLVQEVEEWKYSSFHRYVQMGWYPQRWKDCETGDKIANLGSWD
ncbi:MAG TPA: transposase [Bellilinea sp.]